MTPVSPKHYAAAAALAIGALVAGPMAWSALQPERTCGGTPAGGGDIGGPFTLVSETGAEVTEREVIAGPTLIYFGYTFCPDICPLDAARNAEAVELLAERGIAVRPVFVSVDPARDTPRVLADFTGYLHPDMLGLTGSPEQVSQAAAAFGVYYRLHEGEHYLVDHSTATYLMQPRGLVDVFARDLTAAETAERIACHLGA